mmetsp:Transcript_4801/g.21735  ORF Transcript_4801/g.21735 Transcript_4801/m.21735 type:complete len:219 (-) Transcript_4801:2549-3205(-)
MRELDEASNLLQPTAPTQQVHELRQRPVVARVLLEQLRKVVDCGFVVFLLEHELGEHEGGFLVVGVVPEHLGARLLARVDVPRVEPHPGQRQQRGHVAPIVRERFFVEPERGLDVVARLVQTRDLDAEHRHEPDLFSVLFPISPRPRHQRLSHRVCAREGVYPPLAVLDPLADLREHPGALHPALQRRRVHRVLQPVHQLCQPILRLAESLQADVQRG